MARTKISEFSSTPGNNTDIDGINIAEGCAPSGINDAIRELMAQLKDFQAGTAGDSFNGPVGTTTAAAGAFTTLSASSTVSGAGFSNYLASPPAIGGTTPAAGSFTALSATGNTTLGDVVGDLVTVNGTTTFVNANPTFSAGTANGVAYLNGSKVLTTGSALTYNGTLLTIRGGNASTLQVDNGGQQYTELDFANNGVVKAPIYWDNTASNFYIGSSGQMQFAAGGGNPFVWTISSEQMRLTSTGLGIGTSSPGAKLHVLGSGIFDTQGTSGSLAVNSYGSLVGRIRTPYSGTAYNILALDVISGGKISFSNNTVEQMALDSSGNLGLGVTPSAWFTANSFRAFQLTNGASIHGQLGGGTQLTGVSNNWFANSAGTDTYINNGFATQYRQWNGAHSWLTAPSGTAGNAISFTQAMTLDASGRLGIGTTSPASLLHIASSTVDPEIRLVRSPGSGNINTIKSDLNDLSFTSGQHLLFNAGAAERARISSDGTFRVKGAGTAGSTDAFQVPGSAPADAARITSNGDFLVGTTSVNSSATGFWYSPNFSSVTGNGTLYVGNSQTTNSDFGLNLYSTGASAYRFYVGMGGTVYATNTTISAISDIRFKENIQDLDVGLNAVMALKPRKFDWKEGKGKDIKGDRGFIAQEFEQVFPDLIDEWRDPAPEGEEPYKSVRADLIPVLVKAIQEQQAIINDLRARVAALESK